MAPPPSSTPPGRGEEASSTPFDFEDTRVWGDFCPYLNESLPPEENLLECPLYQKLDTYEHTEPLPLVCEEKGLSMMDDFFSIDPENCYLSDTEPIQPTPETLLSNLRFAVINHFSATHLPSGNIFTTQFIGDRHFYVEEGSSLELGQPIIINSEGRIESGNIKVNGYAGVRGTVQVTTMRGHHYEHPNLIRLEGIRFDRGHILVKVDIHDVLDFLTPDFVIDWILNKIGGGRFDLEINDNDEIDITDALKSIFNIPAGEDVTWENFIAGLRQGLSFPEIESSSWNVSVADIDLNAIEIGGYALFDDPLYRDPVELVAAEIPKIDFSIQGIENANVTLYNPRLWTEDCQHIAAAEAIGLSLHQLRWDFNALSVNGYGHLTIDGGKVQLPGRLKPEPVTFHLEDASPPLSSFEFNINPLTGGHVRATVGISEIWSYGDEFQFHGKGQGEALLTIDPAGQASLNSEWFAGLHSERGMMTRNIEGGAHLFCNANITSPDLGSRMINIPFDCVSNRSSLEWFNDVPLGDQEGAPLVRVSKFRADQIPNNPQAFHGEFNYSPEEIRLHVAQGGLNHHLNIPRIATTTRLEITPTNDHGYFQGLQISIRDRFVKIDLDVVRNQIQSTLENNFLSSPMFSSVEVDGMYAEIDLGENEDSEERGNTVVTPRDPEKNPYFLRTKAKGQLTLARWGMTFPIDNASLKISKLTYTQKTRKVTLSGDIYLAHRLVPNELLEGLPLQMLTAQGEDQEILVRFHTDNIVIDRQGLVIPTNAQISVVVTKPSKPPEVENDPHEVKHPSLYPFSPPLSPSEPYTPQSLLPTDVSLAPIVEPLVPLLLNAIERIREFSIGIQHEPGYAALEWDPPKIPILYPALPSSLSMEWEDPGYFFFRMRTRPSPETSRESFDQLYFRMRKAARVCLNIYHGDKPNHPGDHDGHCITQPDFQWEGFHLRTEDGPFPESHDPFGDSTPTYRPRAGELIFHFKAFSDQSLAEVILNRLGITHEDYEKAGIPLRGDHLLIPVDFAEFKKLFTVVWPKIVDRLFPSGKTGEEESSVRMTSRLPLETAEIPFNIDANVNLQEVASVCLAPLDESRDTGKPHAHIGFQPAPHSRVQLKRPAQALNRLSIGPLTIDTLSLDPDITHSPLPGAATHSGDQDVSFRGITIEEGYIEKNGGRIVFYPSHSQEPPTEHFPLQIGHIDFRFRDFEGSVTGYKVHHGYIDTGLQPRFGVPALTLGSGLNVIDDVTVTRHLPDGRTVTMKAAPRFPEAYISFLPGYMAIGADDVTSPYFSVTHHHMSLDGMTNIRAKKGQGFIPLNSDNPGTDLTSLFDPNAPFIFQTEDFSFEGGAMSLLGEHLSLGHTTSMKNLILRVQNEDMSFEVEDLDATLKDLALEFIHKLPLPKDMVIHSAHLDYVHLQNGSLADSSFVNGNLLLQGHASLTTEGSIDFTYKGVRLQSPFKIHIPHVYKMRSQDHKLDEFVFEGAEAEFYNYSASIRLFNALSIDIKPLKDRPTTLKVTIPYGTFNFSNRGTEQPIVDFPVINIEGQALGRGEADISTGKTRVNLSYPAMRSQGETTMGLTIIDGPGGLKIRVPVYQMEGKALMQKPEIHMKSRSGVTP